MYEELDREKCENSIVDFSQKRSLKIIENIDKLELSEKSEERKSVNDRLIQWPKAVTIVSDASAASNGGK